MFELWSVRVDGGDGKEIYGEDYIDIWAMNRLHFKAATKGTCDHVSKVVVVNLRFGKNKHSTVQPSTGLFDRWICNAPHLAVFRS